MQKTGSHVLFGKLRDAYREGVHATPQALRVDPRFYTDPHWFQTERDAVFRDRLVVVGHASMLKKPGDHFVHDHTGQPILVVRGQDGVIRAFLNVCRHRGVRLSNAQGVVNRPSFVCPYHSWTYNPQGDLVHIPLEQEAFGGVDKSCHGLRSLVLKQVGGLLFVCPDPQGQPDVDAQLGDLVADLDHFDVAGHHFFRESVSVKKTNWKLVIEAFLDGYHIQRLHRKTVGPLFLDAVAMSERTGLNSRSVVARNEFEQALTLDESEWDLRQHVSCAYFLFPNTELIIHPDYISYLSLFPVSVNETVVVHGCLIESEPDSDKAMAHWNRAFDIIENGVFQAEDLFVCEQAQIGMASGANDSLLLGGHERGIADFHLALAEVCGPFAPTPSTAGG